MVCCVVALHQTSVEFLIFDHACLPSPLSVLLSAKLIPAASSLEMMSYQCSHGTVKHMSVVSPELGVGTLERSVSVSFGLLDAKGRCPSAFYFGLMIQILNALSLVYVRRAKREDEGIVPVLVRLLRLVVLRGVL